MPGVKAMVSRIPTVRRKQPIQQSLSGINVQLLIEDFRDTGNVLHYRTFFHRLKTEKPSSETMCFWIDKMTENTNIAYKNTDIFLDFMEIPWGTGDLQVVKAFNHYILSLVTENSSIAQCVLDRLISQLTPKPQEITPVDPSTATLEDFPKHCMIEYTNICNLVVAVVSKVPLLKDSVCPLIVKYMPFPKLLMPVHMAYLHNLLLMSQLTPKSRTTFLEILLKYLLSFDLSVPRSDLLPGESSSEDVEDIFAMEMEECKSEPDKPVASINPVAHTLDVLMSITLNYVHGTVHGCTEVSGFFSDNYVAAGCRVGSRSTNGIKHLNQGCECKREQHQDKMAVQLYLDLKKVFPLVLLPTYSPSYVQFIYLYILAIRPPLISDFLDFLTNKFHRMEHLVLRRNALCYLGSLVSRGSFISFSFVSSTLEILTRWCLDYARSKINTNDIDTENLWKYAPFNCACQIIFYIFTFRYRELVDDKNIKFTQSLNLMDLVSSPLNPLANCSDEIADKFAAVANHFQIAYCYNILERNRRIKMPVDKAEDLVANAAKSTLTDKMYFPFEPYLLPRSSRCIKNHYSDFSGFEENISFRQESTQTTSNSFDDYLNLDISLS